MNEYTKQAQDFLAETGTALTITFLYTGPHFEGEKDFRDTYRFTLKNSRGEYTGSFGDSIRNTAINALCKNRYAYDRKMLNDAGIYTKYRQAVLKLKPVKPSEYDILACITKNDPGTFSDFCGDFGYDGDSKKAEKIYFAVQKEYQGIRKLFTHEQIEKLQEVN